MPEKLRDRIDRRLEGWRSTSDAAHASTLERDRKERRSEPVRKGTLAQPVRLAGPKACRVGAICHCRAGRSGAVRPGGVIGVGGVGGVLVRAHTDR